MPGNILLMYTIISSFVSDLLLVQIELVFFVNVWEKNKSLLYSPSVFPRTAEFFGAVHAVSEAPPESTGVPSSATGRKRDT